MHAKQAVSMEGLDESPFGGRQIVDSIVCSRKLMAAQSGFRYRGCATGGASPVRKPASQQLVSSKG